MILNTAYDILKDVKFTLNVGTVSLNNHGAHYELRENNNLWNTFNYKDKCTFKQFDEPNNMAFGICVLSGLGNGILSNLVLNNPKVQKVIVYEKYLDVINLNKIISFVDLNKITVINKPVEDVKDIECDCLFLDHYELEPREYITHNSKQVAENIKHKKLWVWYP